MSHILFIHSSVSEHLGCSKVLATVINAAMNIKVHVLFQIICFSRYMPRSGVAGSYAINSQLFLVFKGTFILFSTVALSVYVPINSVGGFPSLHTLSSIYCL